MKQFGIGVLYGTPISGGNNATPSFTQRFGIMKEVSVEFNQKLEKLLGQNKMPEDIAPGDMEFKGKASFAEIEVDVYNSLFFGDVVAAGSKAFINGESHTLDGSNTTVTHNGNNTFYQDLGVRYAANGVALRAVTAGNEATGLYSVDSTGKYTFGGNDAGNNVVMLIDYAYTSASGKTLTVTQHLMGYGPVFEVYCTQPYQSTGNGLHLFACRAAKMSMPMTRNAHMFSDFEFEAFANAAGNIMEVFQTSN
jgi:hypothetical protein